MLFYRTAIIFIIVLFCLVCFSCSRHDDNRDKKTTPVTVKSNQENSTVVSDNQENAISANNAIPDSLISRWKEVYRGIRLWPNENDDAFKDGILCLK